MEAQTDYTMTPEDVAKEIGSTAGLVSKLADLPDGDPERIPNYYKPRTDGKRDRRFRPSDVQAWKQRHGFEAQTCTCGGTITDVTETTSAQPTGTGYVLRACEDCGTEYDRRYIGH